MCSVLPGVHMWTNGDAFGWGKMMINCLEHALGRVHAVHAKAHACKDLHWSICRASVLSSAVTCGQHIHTERLSRRDHARLSLIGLRACGGEACVLAAGWPCCMLSRAHRSKGRCRIQ